MKTMIKESVKMFFLSVSIIGLSGCAAMNTAITHRNLDVQTKMSKSVFLKPVPQSQKTIYVDIHNTSNQSLHNVKLLVISAVKSQGYRVVRSSNNAHYLLQANILKIGKSSQSAAENYLSDGFGGALSGGVIGAATGGLVNGSNESIIGGGLIGGVFGAVTNDLITDTTYTMITDIQISERLPKGVYAQSVTTAAMQQGMGSSQVTRLSGSSSWMQYRVRVVSTADKVNLKFKEAQVALEKQLAHAVANVF